MSSTERTRSIPAGAFESERSGSFFQVSVNADGLRYLELAVASALGRAASSLAAALEEGDANAAESHRAAVRQLGTFWIADLGSQYDRLERSVRNGGRGVVNPNFLQARLTRLEADPEIGDIVSTITGASETTR